MKISKFYSNDVFNTYRSLIPWAIQVNGYRFLQVIGLTTVSAICRIFVLLVIGSLVSIFTSEEPIYFLNKDLSSMNELSVIAISTLVFAALSFIAAVTTFKAAKQARSIGRNTSEHAVDETFEAIQRLPNTPYETSSSLPRPAILLTQSAIHTGHAVQTLTSLINPIVMVVFAVLTLTIKQPIIGICLMLSAPFMIVVLFNFTKSFRNDAQDFYSEKASSMSKEVSSNLVKIMNQKGFNRIADYSLSKTSAFQEFYYAMDSNLLANNRVTYFVSLFEAFFRSILLFTLCLLVYKQLLNAQQIIITLGIIAYIIGSTKTVTSLVTNLVRYSPQVKNFVTLLSTDRETNAQSNDNPSLASLSIFIDDDKEDAKTSYSYNSGESIMLFTDFIVNSLSIRGLLNRFLTADIERKEPVSNALYFVNKSFKFVHGSTIKQQLTDQLEPSNARFNEVLLKLDRLGNNLFADCENGYETVLNEIVWDSLSSLERYALRTIPLSFNEPNSIVCIDYYIASQAGDNNFSELKNLFNDKFLIVFSNDGEVKSNPEANYNLLITQKTTKCGQFDKLAAEAKASALPDYANEDDATLSAIL